MSQQPIEFQPFQQAEDVLAFAARNFGRPLKLAFVHSDVRQQIEIFVVFILAALAFFYQFLRFDKFDSFDPLDHFVAELVFDTQAKRRAVDDRQWLAVHLISEETLRLH